MASNLEAANSTATREVIVRREWVFVFFLALFFLSPAQAAIDAYSFESDEQRDRYNALIDELRCPMCLNTNLAGSDAMIGQALRREVHRLVLEGNTDDEILDFMYERYGDFILYEPRVTQRTIALWFGPLLLLMIAGFVGWRITRSQRGAQALSDDELSQLDEIMSDSNTSTGPKHK